MDDTLDFDTATRDGTMVGNFGGNASKPVRPTRGGQELAVREPIDIYHWALVALVTALMCAVLGYAAGTPALSRAANVTSAVFGVLGVALMAGGVLRNLRMRFTMHGVAKALAGAETH
ncbi:hypothetical protein [Caballeronia sp. GAWG1-1]|uniref:hypothetical protein n=1 Tax=Caballeronia sp. GAWG1-1 TaxID=2921742 RepID=UPI0020292C70|nr:hypothetical protein [Caballeronia sp. GAWG1-1]